MKSATIPQASAPLENLEEWEDFLKEKLNVWLIECPAAVSYTQARFHDGDCLLFGPETRGLPPEVRDRYAGHAYTIPLLSVKVRSLNLATAAGIVLYEGLRQLHSW